jgi:hypothetical protein
MSLARKAGRNWFATSTRGLGGARCLMYSLLVEHGLEQCLGWLVVEMKVRRRAGFQELVPR